MPECSVWDNFAGKNFHNGTNIVVKHYTNLLGGVLEFFMAPTAKSKLSVLAQKIPAHPLFSRNNAHSIS
jgi:hypothetical protein